MTLNNMNILNNSSNHDYGVLFLAVLEIKPRTLQMQDRCYDTEPHFSLKQRVYVHIVMQFYHFLKFISTTSFGLSTGLSCLWLSRYTAFSFFFIKTVLFWFVYFVLRKQVEVFEGYCQCYSWDHEMLGMKPWLPIAKDVFNLLLSLHPSWNCKLYYFPVISLY